MEEGVVSTPDGLYISKNAVNEENARKFVDFMTDKDFEKEMQICANKHDLVALRITDRREMDIPKVGLVKFRDSETGKERWVDTSSRAWHDAYQQMIQYKSAELNREFTKHGIDNSLIYTDEDYVKPLMQLFKKREARRWRNMFY